MSSCPFFISAEPPACGAQPHSQRECLPDDFPYLEGKDISLANLENCFCEWRKYLTAKAGKTNPRRFEPHSNGQ